MKNSLFPDSTTVTLAFDGAMIRYFSRSDLLGVGDGIRSWMVVVHICFVTNIEATYSDFIGYIDVVDGYWGRNMLVTT